MTGDGGRAASTSGLQQCGPPAGDTAASEAASRNSSAVYVAPWRDASPLLASLKEVCRSQSDGTVLVIRQLPECT